MDETRSTLTYDEVFTLPLGDFNDIMERAEEIVEKDNSKSSTKCLISDANEQLEDAIVDFIKNVHLCTRATPNKIKAVRLGFESSKSTTRRIMKEHYSSEKLIALGKLACLIGCDSCPAKDAVGGLLGMLKGMPGIAMPGGGKGFAINADNLPPEVLEKFQGLLEKLARTADLPEGEVTQVGGLELRKPPKGDAMKSEMDEIDRMLDDISEKRRRGEKPGGKPDENK